MEIRHRGVFVSMGVQFLRKGVHRSHFLLKLRFFAKKKRSYFGTTFSFCVGGVLERTCLHPAAMDMTASCAVGGSRLPPVLSRGESQVLFLSKTLPQALSRFFTEENSYFMFIFLPRPLTARRVPW